MFNRQSFNGGKFNVVSAQIIVTGATGLSLIGAASANLAFFAPPTSICIKLNSRATYTSVLYAAQTKADLFLAAKPRSGLRNYSPRVKSKAIAFTTSPKMKRSLGEPSNGRKRISEQSPSTGAMLGFGRWIEQSRSPYRHYFALAMWRTIRHRY